MITPDTGRQRASRIPLDYFKTASLWERRKWFATVAVVAVAAVWWAGGIFAARQTSAFHSPGTLASVHHTWESQCLACHTDFAAIHADALGARWAGGTSASDQKCQLCHAGAEHHPVKAGTVVPGCSACHHDHQGSQASLVRMDDASCTQCHAAIQERVAVAPLDSNLLHVTRFDKEHHPEFALAKKDPGHLKFSHYRHMTPGLVNNPGQDKDDAVWTLARIADPVQRERYRRPGQRDDERVQLDCGSCHQLDSGDFTGPRPAGVSASALPARSAGDHMLPITYENQCQACHRLYETPGIVHHRETPQQIREDLKRAFAQDYLEGNKELLDRYIPSEPLPNARPSLDEKAAQRIREKIETAEQVLSEKYCGKCHEPAATGLGLQPFLPTSLPQVWFQHATFSHRAHRAMECSQCHEAAYADAPNPSRQGKDAMIPNRNVCLNCHAPASTGLPPAGGARFDCVECHRYHNGAAPLAGSGARANGPAIKLTEEEFEEAKPKQ